MSGAVTTEQLSAEFEQAIQLISGDHSGLLGSFLEPIRDDIRSNFNNSQTAGREPWRQRKDNKTHPLLRLSGALEAAATGRGAGHVETISGNELAYGVSGIIYAARQNYGDTPGSRDSLGRAMNIPAREYMAISEDTSDLLADMAAKEMLSYFEG